ncbi:MAG: xanthine dehydrogenase family protein molybdopterin-binding subunit [Gemmatimonadetes bacterium]|nr:xanthine dehydrogenase family protein molybdopterin-binding subunit [Gemmatimonadota bacterium]
MSDYAWPDASRRTLLGKRIQRLDGPTKSSGRATYTYDVRRPGMLFGKIVVCPHAHARVTSVDTSATEAMPGVRAVDVIQGPGKEIQWAGAEVAAVAADTEEQARDAARSIKVVYEVLPFMVRDSAPSDAGAANTEVLAEQKEGDPDQGFRDGEVVAEGLYGSPVITHCCLEAHGQVCEWEGDNLTVWASTQSVSGLSSQFAQALGIPASNVRILCPVMGGGFGSKFSADPWGLSCARMARKAGRPVKMMLERDHDLMVAGCRPSMYARARVAAKRDGTLTAWSSESWGTGGIGPAGSPVLPYVIPVANRRSIHTRVKTNIGPARAWRAPNHPQMCLITMAALEDLAAKLEMDPLDLFLKNVATHTRGETYRAELLKAAELMEWRRKWHPRGDRAAGPVKRGLGLSLHTWGGGGHESNSIVAIHPDGSVEVSLGSQDIGTGTRTVIAIVVAETLGLPIDAVTVNIGDSRYPQSGASGGSTTVGGVSSSTRVAATEAFHALAAKVAPSLGVPPEQLEARGGRVQAKGDPSRGLSWQQACARLGSTDVTANGTRNRDLISSGVGGVQMADVSVDVETGVVTLEKLVAVQDCGLVVDLQTAESQVYGALIMGVCYALYEEKLMDSLTGGCLNPDMEFYKLAGIGDIGELVVHMMTGPGYDERGVIGLGEPPVISPGAAISNAVANAIGARVSTLPLTPDKVLAVLETGGRV